MKLVKDENYQRKERKFFKKHVHLVDKYAEVLTKLKTNPFDPSLKTHRLKR
jgi:mRNA-degrading endonuclease YafQ of YafQ-DinJ toxin-antitoxin module